MLNRTLLVLIVPVLFIIDAKAGIKENQLDVISYHLIIEPNINEESVNGSVTINFQVNRYIDSVVFNSGKLVIDAVKGNNVESYKKINNNLIIYLSKTKDIKNEIVIDYHGHPKMGLVFDPEQGQTYTVYFTSKWMICNDSPNDKALFDIDIIVPNDRICIASGELVNKTQQKNKTLYSYRLNTESPSYTYGFAIGKYNEIKEKHGRILLKYYSQNYNTNEIIAIFKETPNMISFFEEISGVKYFQSTYSQVLTGKYYQEMSGFSLLKDAYGKLVLQDSTEINIISHELAHQWWGNNITCKSWGHFWLNEGMATFLSAAYNEFRFGKEVYLANIDSYHKVYEEVKKTRQ